LLLGGLVFFSIIFFSLFVPIFDKSTLYRLAGKPDPTVPIRQYILRKQRSPDYVIENNKIYLAYAYKANSLLLAVEESPVPWNVLRLKAFRKDHPELEDKWPEPLKENAGVAWIQ
jgi:hypothetical protein